MNEKRRHFEASEYHSRQQKTRAAMVSKGIDLLLVTDPANMNWLTGYDAWSFYTHQCVVIGTDDTLFWFGRGIDYSGAIATTDLTQNEIVAYSDDYVQSTKRHPMQYLAVILKERNLTNAVIGVEKDNYYFSALAAEVLYKKLPDTKFTDATALVNWQRAIKSPKEIEYMRGAGYIIESTYKRILDIAQPGMRKNDLVAEIIQSNTQGVDGYFGDYTSIVPLMGTDDEAGTCHLTWNSDELRPNSGLFFELAAAHKRYHCPCSRTFYFGQPPPKYIDMEKIINEGINNTLDLFKPGNSCGEVALSFHNTLKKYGYEKDSRYGYAIGMSYLPDWGERTMSIRISDKTELQEGMTFHFIPAMWLDDLSFEMTESVLVTDKGAACLSQVPRKLFVK